MGYQPRSQFQGFHHRTERWAILVAHRRCGKTVACINDLILAALISQKAGSHYAYIAPYFTQAKDIAFGYLKQFTIAIPGMRYNEGELRADFPNGSRVRLYGADNYERLRGIFLDGVVLDEFGDMDPRAWSEVIRPALADRRGWAVFIGTPKGMNHFAEMWDKAQGAKDWFSLRLPASETGILPQAELDDARREMTDEQYAAEFECSFAASVVGAYWGRELAAAESAGRITSVPYAPEIGVETWWDLGVSDATAIWFTQTVGREVRIIDYYEQAGEGLPHYARILQERGYFYTAHHAPHDIGVRELGTGKSRLEVAASLGIKFELVPNLGLPDGIDIARSFLARCWFDRSKTQQGRQALTSYHKAWDEKRKVFQDRPFHNWASHAADAFRYLAVGHKGSATPRFQAGARRPSQGSSGSWMGA